MHRGQKLKQLVKNSGHTVEEAAFIAGLTRDTLYKWFRIEKLEYYRIKKLCDALKIDFSKNYESEEYVPSAQESDYREKYYQLLEEHNNLLREYKEKYMVNEPGQNRNSND